MVEHCTNVHDFKPMPCTFSNCNFVAFNHTSHAQHISKFHSKHKVYANNLFQCSVKGCERSFGSRFGLEIHVRVHQNDLLPCVFCPFRTTKDSDLSLHYRSHYKIRDFSCDICGKTFLRASTLLLHEENFHQKGEVFECQFCGFTSTRMRLQKHLKNKHNMSSHFNKVTKSYDTFEK